MIVRALDELAVTELRMRLATLHDRGLVNEDALISVCAALGNGVPLSRDHLVSIFGVLPIYKLMTTHDETAWQLVREMYDAETNPESPVDRREWAKTVARLLDAQIAHEARGE